MTTEDVLRATQHFLRGARRSDDDDARINAVRIRMPNVRAKIDQLPEAAMQKAQLVRSSTEFFNKGASATQEFLDRTARGWTVDAELSNRSSVVLTRGPNEVVVAYRGTKWNQIQDVMHNAATLAGAEEFSTQTAEARAQMRAVLQKYGTLPSELLGYSRGGNLALTLGDEFGIRSTTYNPAISPKQLSSVSTTEHTIYRTTEDAVSTLLAFAKHKRNFTVSAIEPIVGLGDPKGVHDLQNFTSSGPRQPGGTERLMREGLLKGQQLAHFETVDAMATGVEREQSFTEALDDFNRTQGARQTVDVTESGRLGPRIHRQSGTVKYWRAAGGTFTPAEEAHLASNPSPPERPITPEAAEMGISHDPLTTKQIRYVASLGTEERASFMQTRRAELQAHHERVNASVRPHEEVIRAAMPRVSSLAVGVVGGVAAHALMENLDPDHHLHPVAAEGIEGAVSGGIGAASIAALGGSVALGPEVLAGAAAYVAGAESQKAITKGLRASGMDEEGAEAVGSVSGGAIGGLAAVGTSIGATIAADVLLGFEVGAMGGLPGAIVGAGVGLTLGAATGAIGYLHARAGRDAQHEEEREETMMRVQDEVATAGVQAVIPQRPPSANPPRPPGSRTPVVVLGNRHVAAEVHAAGVGLQARRYHELLGSRGGTTAAPPRRISLRP